jgi:hypothetical protein
LPPPLLLLLLLDPPPDDPLLLPLLLDPPLDDPPPDDPPLLEPPLEEPLEDPLPPLLPPPPPPPNSADRPPHPALASPEAQMAKTRKKDREVDGFMKRHGASTVPRETRHDRGDFGERTSCQHGPLAAPESAATRERPPGAD